MSGRSASSPPRWRGRGGRRHGLRRWRSPSRHLVPGRVIGLPARRHHTRKGRRDTGVVGTSARLRSPGGRGSVVFGIVAGAVALAVTLSMAVTRALTVPMSLPGGDDALRAAVDDGVVLDGGAAPALGDDGVRAHTVVAGDDLQLGEIDALLVRERRPRV